MSWGVLVKSVWLLVFLGISVITVYAVSEYQGSSWAYLLFTLLSTAVLFFGFGRGAIFFDAFIGVLLWLGFWLKFSVRVAFFDSAFQVSVGGFDGSPAAYDRTLLVVSCALSAILLARFIRQRFLFSYPSGLPEIEFSGLFCFYKKYRTVLLVLFAFSVCVVCFSNAWFGIYQRGMVSRTVLPFGLNGVYTWLLSFGLASVSALILRFEFELNREKYWIAVVVSLFEAALSNVSLLSRGMILNGSALAYGATSLFKRAETHVRVRLAFFAFIVFGVLFFSSVLVVNALRADFFYMDPSLRVSDTVAEQTTPLFLDRWVGIEGVMSVVGGKGLGWELFGEAVKESFDYGENSFYDKNFIITSYDNSRDDNRHFISLPGYIAFLFYPGSYAFLFFAVFVFSKVAFVFEYFVYRVGGRNLVLCALIAQVVAFRYTSFGYVPLQSYMLFGSIVLNVLILFFSDRLLRHWCRS